MARPPPGSDPKAEREARLAAALRANLRRRKAANKPAAPLAREGTAAQIPPQDPEG